MGSVDELPLIVLSLRNIAKEDLGCTPIELIVDTPLSLPIFYFYGNSNPDSNLTRQFIQELRKKMAQLQYTLSLHAKMNIYFQEEYQSYEYVLKRNEVIKIPLTHKHQSPFISRADKYFTIKFDNDTDDNAICRLKLAVMERNILSPLQG